ncbi:MAG: hypothetical protein AAFV95_08520 [Bacteroidota bacterium]
MAQKLLHFGKRGEGMRLVQEAYETAEAYEFMYLLIELAAIFHHEHSFYEIDPEKANFYADKIEEYQDIYSLNKKVERLYYQTQISSGDADHAAIIQKGIQKIKAINGKTTKYFIYLTVLEVQYGFKIGDYPRAEKKCAEGISFFQGLASSYSSYIYSLSKSQGLAQMALTNYADADQSFEQASMYCPPKSFNDYLLRYYRIINALHAGHYNQAYIWYRQNRNCRFEKLRLHFAILGAYLCFLSHTGLLVLERRFRLGKYLNETIRSQASQKVNNINVLIAELLVHLVRDRGKFIDRVEAAEHYSYRHLKDPGLRRAKWFLKIICRLPAANFHPDALRRRTQKYFDLLEKHPLALGERFEVEIVPFDILLGLVLKQLKRKTA